MDDLRLSVKSDNLSLIKNQLQKAKIERCMEQADELLRIINEQNQEG